MESLPIDIEITPFFELTPDLVCIAGKDGYFRKVNKAVTEKLGYTHEELYAQPISYFIHPDDKAHTAQERARLLNGQNLINFQNRYLCKNSDIIWLQWTSIYFADREVVFAIAKDITERKLIELDIEEKFKKFKGLAAHFKTSIEKDRKFLAVELHEELAQLASVVKMDVEWIKEYGTELPPMITERIDHAAGVASLLIKSIRRISFALSPNMIEDVGFHETIKWLCREFSILNGIPCTYKSEIPEKRLPQEIKLDLFRICQEALTNVMYHAAASEVMISLKENDPHFILTISDNGKGFSIAEKKTGTGLNDMRKRALSINGTMVIKSSPGKGTKVQVKVDGTVVNK